MLNYMIIETETVKRFLKMKGIEWDGKVVRGKYFFHSFVASSEDFNGEDLTVDINNKTLYLSISPTQFLIKGESGFWATKLVVLQNHSDEWQQYLVETCKDKETLNKLLDECELEIIRVDEELEKEIERLLSQIESAKTKRNEQIARIKKIKKTARNNLSGR